MVSFSAMLSIVGWSWKKSASVRACLWWHHRRWFFWVLQFEFFFMLSLFSCFKSVRLLMSQVLRSIWLPCIWLNPWEVLDRVQRGPAPPVAMSEKMLLNQWLMMICAHSESITNCWICWINYIFFLLTFNNKLKIKVLHFKRHIFCFILVVFSFLLFFCFVHTWKNT